MNGEPFPDRFRRWYGMLPPALRVLMTVNTVLYVFWVLIHLLGLGGIGGVIVGLFALFPTLPEVLFRPWQIVTYGFLNIQPGLWGFIAFAFHMLWLYWLGREYEEFYGSHRLFSLYILSAIGGALLAILATATIGPPAFPIAGAMAAVLGVICGVATLNPDRGIGLFLLGVVKMKWVAIAFVTLMVLFTWQAGPAYVAAYLGGALTGYGFGRAQLAGRDLGAWARFLFPGKSSPYAYGTSSRSTGGGFSRMGSLFSRRSETEAAEPSPVRTSARRRTLANSKDNGDGTREPDVVDRLLDKINEKGYDSLTEDEKRILYEASKNE